MESVAFNQLKEYIQGLTERELWALLVEYFLHLGIKADIVHSTGEHGMDVAVLIDPSNDLLGIGCNVLIQAKTGQLGLERWREKVLYQILELPYYTIPHPSYTDHLARRVLLVVTGSATLEARRSIEEFNKKHDFTIELWEIDEVIRQFDRHDFAELKLEQITGVGYPAEAVLEPPTAFGEPGADVSVPPVVGDRETKQPA
jgi:hypothetical protein